MSHTKGGAPDPSWEKPPSSLDAVPYYHSIREALTQPGCPLCRLLSQDADRYLDSVLWEMVNDSGVRSELNQARGYCQEHGWLLVRAGAALGVAILMRSVVKTLLDELEANPGEPGAGSAWHRGLFFLDRKGRSDPAKTEDSLAKALSPQVPCPVCARLQDKEAAYTATLLSHLEGPGALAPLLRSSDGLCLSHFRLALGQAPRAATANVLVAAQQSIWERLHSELDEFIRKNDHRFRDETFGEEKDSWRRALEAISGPQPRSRSGRQGLAQSL